MPNKEKQRTIKFRGKRIDNGEWVYGFLALIYTKGKDKNGFIYDNKAMIYSPEDVKNYDVDLKTVGQYIGLKDRNKKEIYEGDIIKYYGKAIQKFGRILYYFNGMIRQVEWKRSKTYCGYSFGQNPKRWEIIGNIFENPNLIK